MAIMDLNQAKIGVIGLGYVGLPLAVEFGFHFDTVGFDIDKSRIAELIKGIDRSLEVEPEHLLKAKRLSFWDDEQGLRDCTVYVVTVPTPVDEHKRPDLTPLINASRLLGRVIGKGDVAIFESTVYPGATEEACVPEIERVSGLRFNRDFFVGYSPERINPGDKAHRLPTIKKITSGSTPAVADFVDALYQRVIIAGTHRASSIKIAEAAKVIENIQRDVNIALINELSLIFNKLGIDTLEVLEAAGTKWNFLPFRPGLVGGHCIGVDPYYLTHKAQAIGYQPEMILAGRRINDGMGEYVAGRVVKMMVQRKLPIGDARILILGVTFKENCPDTRNTRVVDIIDEFRNFGIDVDVYDPWADPVEAKKGYGLDLLKELDDGRYQATILAVAHDQFSEMGVDEIRSLMVPGGVLFDVKALFPPGRVDGRL
jgi:UDP-N-acetyl-D-glucosamine/UDP-N-acetyl-D-galactosamine dehydrogenase